ncbi:hypothetical protein AVEN_95951-1 [Araneus ventricosus]|uniref:Uncharacterized protein n=1 Tax=Araneus ventricosus TaxID=182803 RepID=A0A4Y2VIH8_ARAVE|nr:hypothetical protein AVEN_95951-1 [Araneus ventricosus]
MANKKKTSTEPTKSLVLGENISQYSSTLQLSLSSSMNDQKELLTFDEDAPISKIIKRLRNIVNCKEIDRSHLSDKKVDIANSLLDVLVFKCIQLTEKALFNAEATLQKNLICFRYLGRNFEIYPCYIDFHICFLKWRESGTPWEHAHDRHFHYLKLL